VTTLLFRGGWGNGSIVTTGPSARLPRPFSLSKTDRRPCGYLAPLQSWRVSPTLPSIDYATFPAHLGNGSLIKGKGKEKVWIRESVHLGKGLHKKKILTSAYKACRPPALKEEDVQILVLSFPALSPPTAWLGFSSVLKCVRISSILG